MNDSFIGTFLEEKSTAMLLRPEPAVEKAEELAPTAEQPQAKPQTIVPTENKEQPRPKYRVETIQELLDLFNRSIPVVFCGGQHTIWDIEGKKSFSTDRKHYKEYCEQHGIYYYDPQESEPLIKTFEGMRNTDKIAALLCMVDVLTIGKESIGLVTILELLFDLWLDTFPNIDNWRIVQIVDGPMFEPAGIIVKEDGDIDLEAHPLAIECHCRESIRAANLLRNEVVTFIQQSKLKQKETTLDPQAMIICDSEEQFNQIKSSNGVNSCFHISNKDLHVADLVKAFQRVLTGQKVVLFFEGTEKGQIPMMQALPQEAPAEDKQRILKQYLKEGTEIRRFAFDILKKDQHTAIIEGEDKEQIGLQKLIVLMRMLAQKADAADRAHPNPPWNEKINAY